MGSGERGEPRRAPALAVMCCILAGAAIWSTHASAAPENPGHFTPAHTAAIVTLLDVSGTLTRLREGARLMVVRLQADNPAIPAAVWTNLANRVTGREVLESTYVPIYVRHLSEQDAQDVVAFYRTAAGQRFLEASPHIEAQAHQAAQAWAGELARELLTGSAPPMAAAAPGEPASGRISAIHELLRASGTLLAARQMMLDLLDRMKGSAAAEELPAAFWEGARKRLGNEDELMRLWTPAYAQLLSDADIQAMLDFYHGAAGSRFVAALPAIQRESVAAAEQLGHDAAHAAVREVLGPLPQWALSHRQGAAAGSGAAGAQQAPSPPDIPAAR